MTPSKLPLRVLAVDWAAFFEETPPPDVWHETIFRWSADQIHAYQEHHFLRRIAEAWGNPFYRRRWTDAGLCRADITRLEDLEKIPVFNSDDIKASMDAHPPFGEVCGVDGFEYARHSPLKIHTSSGTTGLPRPSLFGALDWELNALYPARALYAQGVRPGDRMQIPVTPSLANMGWSYYKACHDFLGVVPITTGTGVVTPSKRQLELAFRFRSNVWTSFPEYLLHLAGVCKSELGLDIKQLNTKLISTYLGADLDGALRQSLEEIWGCDVYDNYGTHEAFSVAFEAEDKDGMYVMEDAVLLQILGSETAEAMPAGESGDMVCTHLHRRMPLMIRYNLRDIGRLRTDSNSLGTNFRRIDKFLGRSDFMIKIRGTNVNPMSCLRAVASDSRNTGEWLCIARKNSEGQEELIVRVETKDGSQPLPDLRQSLEGMLKEDLGLRVTVELTSEGSLETRVGKEGKPVRLLDERKKS